MDKGTFAGKFKAAEKLLIIVGRTFGDDAYNAKFKLAKYVENQSKVVIASCNRFRACVLFNYSMIAN